MTALRDAFLSAVVALGLFGPLIGLVTTSGEQWAVASGPPDRDRGCCWPGVLGAACHPVLAGAQPRRRLSRPTERLPSVSRRAGKYVTPLLLVAAVALPFSGSRYYVDLGTLVLTYIMLGWGLNIVVGLAGCSTLATSRSMRSAPIPMRLLATTFDLGFWTCLPLAGLFAAFAGMMLGFPVLRLRGDYLAIVTLAFGEIIRIVLINWVSLTNGPNGITGIPRPTLFGLRVQHGWRRRHGRRILQYRARNDPAGHLSVLCHSGPCLADQLGFASAAADAAGPRVGGVAGR